MAEYLPYMGDSGIFAEEPSFWRREELDAEVLKQFRHLPGFPRGNNRSLLDLGCGYGQYTALLADAGYRLTAVDHSSEALAAVTSRLKTRNQTAQTVNFEIYSGQLPFPDDLFDGVLAIHTIYYAPGLEIARVVREVARILIPGGVFIVTLISRADGSFASGEHVKGETYRQGSVVHTYFDESAWKRMFGRFQVINAVHRVREAEGGIGSRVFSREAHWILVLRNP